MDKDRKSLIAKLLYVIVMIAVIFCACRPVEPEIYISIKNIAEIMHETSVEKEQIEEAYDENKFKAICESIYRNFRQDVQYLDDCSKENGIAFLVYRKYELEDFYSLLTTFNELSKQETFDERDKEAAKICFATLYEICDLWESVDWSNFKKKDIRTKEIRQLLADTNRMSLVSEECDKLIIGQE